MNTIQKILTSAIAVITLPMSVGLANANSDAGTDWRYTIRPKDTVSELSQRHLKPHIRWQALVAYNQLPDPHRIQPGTQLRIPLNWLVIQQAHAQITATAGEVQTRQLDGTWHPARTGQTLQTGQHIQAGRNSSARLQFADQSQLVIQPETTVIMDTLSVYAGGLMADTRVRLQAGRVEVQANPQGRKGHHFQVITPAAVATVRGTQFLVEAQPTRTIEQTTQGQVLLQTAQGSVMVQAGYVTAVQAGDQPLPPQPTKPAPALQNPTSRFVDFPINFSWASSIQATGWVMQLGLDPQMAQLTLTQESNTSSLDAMALPNGHYHLRAWTTDVNGLPSQVAMHTFEVAIPRRQQGPSVQLPAQYFAAGPVELKLPALPAGQRHLLQMTRDAAGRQPVWHLANAHDVVRLPVPAEQHHAHHLWLWAY